MYKKIMLSLLLLPIFPSSKLLCMEPIIIYGIVSIGSLALTYAMRNAPHQKSDHSNSSEFFDAISGSDQDTSLDDFALNYAIKNTVETSAGSFDKEALSKEASILFLDYIVAREKLKERLLDGKFETKKRNKAIVIEKKDLVRILVACGGKEEFMRIVDELRKSK